VAGGSNAPGTQPGLNAANQDNDDMYSDGEGQDEDAALQEALELSRVPEKPDQAAQVAAGAEEQQKKEQEQQPAAEVNIDEDFMNDVMNDLGIDMNEGDADKDKDKDGGKDKDDQQKK